MLSDHSKQIKNRVVTVAIADPQAYMVYECEWEPTADKMKTKLEEEAELGREIRVYSHPVQGVPEDARKTVYTSTSLPLLFILVDYWYSQN